MEQTQALSIYTTADAQAYLKNVIVGIFENLAKTTISGKLKSKNANLSQASGSYEFKRFANATAQDYGTAREAGEGQKIVVDPVIINMTINREIVEELNLFDGQSFTQENFEAFVERRKNNIAMSIQRELDRYFFSTAKTGGTLSKALPTITLSKNIVGQLEDLFVELETTSDEFVDGVDREFMALVCSPKLYGKLKTELNDVYNFAGTAEEGTFKGVNGVATFSSNRLPADCDYVLLTMDSIAQPVLSTGVGVEKIPLSNDYAVEAFYRLGNGVLAKNLVLYGKIQA